MNKRSNNSKLAVVLYNILISMYQVFLMTAAFVLWGIQRLLPEQWLELVKKYLTKAVSKIEYALLTCLAILSGLVRWILEIAQGKKRR